MALEFYNRQFAGVLPDRDVAEVAAIYTELAYLDSIHDFWKERARVAGGSSMGSADDDDEPIDEQKLERVRGALVDVVKEYLDTDEEDIRTILVTSTNSGITSATSNFEATAADYLASRTARLRKPESEITYAQILDIPLNIAPWATSDYKRAVDGLGDALSITPGNLSLKKMTDGDRNRIAFFLLAYLDSTHQPGTGAAGTPTFTFDGPARDLDKLLGGITQAKNAIFPQNISDSATTSFSALRGRVNFYKAMPNGDGPYVMKSNGFSRDTHVLTLMNDEKFGPSDRLSFALKIEQMEQRAAAVGAGQPNIPGASRVFTFGISGDQGPSVNYLSDLLVDGPANARATRKVLDLTGIADVAGPVRNSVPRLDPNLIFDLKRTGDAEQVIRAYMARTTQESPVTLVTVDRLCSVFGRLIGLPAIFHTAKGLYVYRGKSTGPISPEKILANYHARANALVELFSVIQDVGVIETELTQMLAHVRYGARTAYVLSVPDEGALEGDWSENNDKIAGLFATSMLRCRLADIHNQINAILTNIGKVQEIRGRVADGLQRVLAADVNAIDEMGEFRDAALSEALSAGERIANAIGGTANARVAFRFDGTREPINIALFDANGRLREGAKSSFFNFHGGPFREIQIIVGKLLRERGRGRPSTKVISELLAAYFRERDAIKEAFIIEGLKNALESWTDIANKANPIDAIGDGDHTLVSAIRTTIENAGDIIEGEPPADANDAGADVQERGEPEPPGTEAAQYRDLYGLLQGICDRVGGFVNALLSRSVVGGARPKYKSKPIRMPPGLRDEGVGKSSLSAMRQGRYAARGLPTARPLAGEITAAEVAVVERERQRVLAASDATRFAHVSVPASAEMFQSVMATAEEDAVELYTTVQSLWALGVDEFRKYAVEYYGIAFNEDEVTAHFDSIFLYDEDGILDALYELYLLDLKFKKDEYARETGDEWDGNWAGLWGSLFEPAAQQGGNTARRPLYG